jgi:hypothetical protein
MRTWERQMVQISDYAGNLLSHVAAVYRPGERDLAVEFVEALGCAAADTPGKAASGSPFVSVHANPDDRDPINNVCYLSLMMPEQLALEQAIVEQMAASPSLADAARAYREAMIAEPASNPHFALNFPSMAALEPVLERLANGLRPELAGRVSLRVIRPGEGPFGNDCTIAFICTDIIVSGVGSFGQLIELQGRPRKFARG